MSEVVGEAVVKITTDESGVDTAGAGKRAGSGFTSGFGGAIKGLVAGAAVVAVAGQVGKSFTDALNFDAANAKMEASLGLTESQAARAGQVAGDLYADNYGDSIEEVQAAIGEVVGSIQGMRNASETDLRAASEAALQYADVFDTDVTAAVQGASRLVSQGLAKDAVEAFDLMTRSSQSVAPALREPVAEAVDEYSQFFSQVGLGGEEMFAVLASASDRGAYGIDKAGDAVKEFTIRATDMSKNSLTAFESVGLNGVQMGNDILAGGDVAAKATQKTIDAILAMEDPALQAQAALALFGTPLEDIGTKNIPQFLEALGGAGGGLRDVAGATAEAATAMYDTPLVQVQEMWRSFQGVLLELAVTALPYVVTAGTAVATLFTGTLLPVLQGQVIPVLQTVATFIMENSTILGTLAVGIGTAVLAWKVYQISLTLVATITKAWAAAQVLLNAVMAANPIALVVIAVVALSAALLFAYQRSSTFREIVQAVGGVLSGVFLGAFRAVAGFITGSMVPAISAVIGFVARLGGAFGDAVGKVAGFGTGLVRLVNGGLDAVREAVASLPGRLLELGGRFLAAGQSIIGKFVEGMKGAGGLVSDIAGNVWDAVRGLLNSAIAKINASLEFTISIPGPDIHINAPNIPALAGGGLVTRPTVALTGEAGTEGVLPLSNPRAMQPIVDALGGGGGNGRSVTVAEGAITVVMPTADPQAAGMAMLNRLVTVI